MKNNVLLIVYISSILITHCTGMTEEEFFTSSSSNEETATCYDSFGTTPYLLKTIQSLRESIKALSGLTLDTETIETLATKKHSFQETDKTITQCFKKLLKLYKPSRDLFFKKAIQSEQSLELSMRYIIGIPGSISTYTIEDMYFSDDYELIHQTIGNIIHQGRSSTGFNKKKEYILIGLYKALINENITQRLFAIFILLELGHYEPSFMQFAMGCIFDYIDQGQIVYKSNEHTEYNDSPCYCWQELAKACFFNILSYICQKDASVFIKKYDYDEIVCSLLKAYSCYTQTSQTIAFLELNEIPEITDNSLLQKPNHNHNTVKIHGIKQPLSSFSSSIQPSESGENDQGIIISIHLSLIIQFAILSEKAKELKNIYTQEITRLEQELANLTIKKDEDDADIFNETDAFLISTKQPLKKGLFKSIAIPNSSGSYDYIHSPRPQPTTLQKSLSLYNLPSLLEPSSMDS